MKTRSPKKQFHFSVFQRMRAIRQALVSRVIVIGFINIIFAYVLFLFFFRSKDYQVFHVALIAMTGLVIPTLIFRRKLPPSMRLIALLMIVNFFTVATLIAYGLLGDTKTLLTLSIVFASVFGSRKTAFGMLLFSIALMLIFMPLHVRGILSIRLSFDEYFHTYHSWILQIISFAIVNTAIMIITTELFRKLRDLLVESTEQVRQIRAMNEELENKVADRTGELEEANKSKSVILGIVAHDINNKLVTIIGSLNLIVRAGESMSGRKREKLTRMAIITSEQTVEIVKELLEYAKMESGEIELPVKEEDIYRLITMVIETHEQTAGNKNITITGPDTAAALVCTINYNKIVRVLDNLLLNAIKFTAEGGIIKVNAQQQQDVVIISVKDSGIGIPDKIKDTLFFPFSESGRPGTSNEPSTGLGLTICKKIIEQHNGRIWFENNEGPGSTFFIQLPDK